MGLFSRKNKPAPKDGSVKTGGSSLLEKGSISSAYSIQTPTTPSFSKKMSTPSLLTIPLPKAPDPNVDPAGYLRSIGAVRERSKVVLEKARENRLNHFDVDMDKFEDTTKFVVSIIKVILSPHNWDLTYLCVCREILPQTIHRFLLMADGNTSTLEEKTA